MFQVSKWLRRSRLYNSGTSSIANTAADTRRSHGAAVVGENRAPLDDEHIDFVLKLFGYDTKDPRILSDKENQTVEDLILGALAESEFESRFNRLTRFRLKWSLPEHAIEIIDRLPATGGAKAALSSARRYGDFLRGLLVDKGFKKFVDDHAVTDHQMRLMRGRMSRLAKAINDADTTPLSSTGLRSSKANKALQGDDPRSAGALKDIDLDSLTWESDQTVMRDAVSRLMRDDAAKEVLRIFHKIYNDDFECGPCLKFYMLHYGMRFFLRQNASDTAFKIGEKLSGQQELNDAAIDTDLINFALVWAQSAIRSGRTELAVSILTKLHVEHPAFWDAQYQLGLILSQTNPKAARMLFDTVRTFPRAAQNALLYISQFFLSMDDPDRSFQVIQGLLRNDAPSADCDLALANTYGYVGDNPARNMFLKKYFNNFHLSSDHLDNFSGDELFGFGPNRVFATGETPLISIIMTAFNASETVVSAANSVLNQTLRNIELLIINDVSTDDTIEKLKLLAQKDDRVVVINNNSNIGTYVSKSHAAARAKGDFVAFHDSDDWMHPQHLERHLNAMTEDVAANHSRWVRMDDDRNAIIRRGGPYLHDNPASTFVRRKVIEEIGYFDPVRTGADTEFISRMRLRYGGASVRRIDEPLAIGLHRPDSLTQAGVAAFDEHRFSRVRLDYWESWVWAHFNCRLSDEQIFVPLDSKASRYGAPVEILAHR